MGTAVMLSVSFLSVQASYNTTTYVAGSGINIDATNPSSPVFTATGVAPDNSISSLASTTANLAGVTYNNGTAGVGATITKSTNGALPLQDGVSLMNGDLLLVQFQTAQLQNGLYVVTDIGSGSTPYILTRSTNADDSDEMNSLVVIPAQGLTLADKVFGQQTGDPIIGTDPIVFATPPNSLVVTQAPGGTQNLYQIPIWTANARQLLKNTSSFTYNTRFRRLVTDAVNNTVIIGNLSGSSVAGNSTAVFIGAGAGSGTVTNAQDSVFIGDTAGHSASSASNSVFIGASAGDTASSANNSIFVGASAGANATSANNANYFGHNAGLSASAAANSNFMGSSAGSAATSAANSNFFGKSAGSAATSADNANFFGQSAGQSASGASHGNFIGSFAGTSATNAASSIFVGTNAGRSATNAANSIFIGNSSGNSDTVNNTISGTSILIGNSTSTGGFGDSVAIGAGATNTATNQLLIASAYTQFNMRGINWTMPSAQGTANTVLTNDGSGNLSWSNVQGSAFSGDLTAQTAAVSSVATITSPNDGSKHTYSLGAYLNVTAVTLDVVQEQVTYTDENGTSQTENFFPSGLTSASLGTVGNFPMQTMNVRVNPNTSITVKTILTTGTGSIAYDVGGTIQLLK